MLSTRRSFLHAGSLALAAAVSLPAFDPAEAAAVPASPWSPPLSPAAQAVVAWVNSYGGEVQVVGAGLLGGASAKLARQTRVLASVSDLDGLEGVLAKGLPAGPVPLFVRGNTISFTWQGEEFVVENLLPADFKKAKAARKTRAGVKYASDGLAWDPGTATVVDPFLARRTKAMKLVNPGLGIVATVSTVLSGYREAAQSGLADGTSFTAYRKRVFQKRVTSAVTATPLVRELIRYLPELTALLTPEQVQQILRTPLYQSALVKALGLTSAELLAKYTQLKAGAAGAEECALWLAALLGPQITAGVADAWLNAADHFQLAKLRAALWPA